MGISGYDPGDAAVLQPKETRDIGTLVGKNFFIFSLASCKKKLQMFGLALGKNVEAEVEVVLSLCFLSEDIDISSDYGILFFHIFFGNSPSWGCKLTP